MSHLMNNYGRLPVSFDHGQGVWLWDKEGHKYLDALAGIAVNSVGHAHPRLVRAIADQARTIRIPVHMVETITRVKKATSQLLHETGREPTPEEIAERLHELELEIQSSLDTLFGGE